ncbi:CBS domain-containing protein [Paenibacillus spongiae]|uniref:CBS domain-containing protein n=1 Tax=Paenibacillus spongiae TaxID=2909671 RepID=A0ABY5SBS6_9BACL|nr:CBS domain-containing protein [Paenibacillus spongiae]UVI30153.1 CBS domain-containing protein [Paenibacillus spongiae]
MQAHEIMVRHVYKVKEQDTIRSVLEKFIDHGISGLPVVNDRNEIVAFISDGDIMRFIGKHKDLVVDTFYFVNVVKGDEDEFEDRVQKILDLNVMSIAKKKVHKVNWDEECENFAALLGEKQIKKLPVERNGVLVGIISRGDVIRNSFKGLL